MTGRTSRVTCPACRREWDEAMPDDACRIALPCPACGVVLRPRPGACCVFCSHGSVPCPPVQHARPPDRPPDPA